MRPQIDLFKVTIDFLFAGASLRDGLSVPIFSRLWPSPKRISISIPKPLDLLPREGFQLLSDIDLLDVPSSLISDRTVLPPTFILDLPSYRFSHPHRSVRVMKYDPCKDWCFGPHAKGML